MSSEDETVIRSVKDVISAVDLLVSDINDASHIQQHKKKQALKTVGLMADHLIQINQVLYEEKLLEKIEKETGSSNTDEAIKEDAPLIATNLTQTFSQALAVINKEEAGSDTQQEPDKDDERSVANLEETAEEKLELLKNEDRPKAGGMRIVLTPHVTAKKATVPPSTEQKNEPLETANNLQLIKGIDNEVASLLNRYDIYRFEDIALFKEADVVRISQLLEDPFRVARQNWIEQAALLAQDISTQYSRAFLTEQGFDRLSLLSEYDNIENTMDSKPVQEQADVVPEFDISPASGLDPDLDHDLESEKELLIAELTSLRKELASRTSDGSKRQHQDQPEADVSSLSPRLQNAIDPSSEGDNQTDELQDDIVLDEPMPQEGLDTLNMDTTRLGDGAMWHEEVSISANYIPPIVDEHDEDEAQQYQEHQTSSNDQSEEENQAPLDHSETDPFAHKTSAHDLMDDEIMADIPDIALPQTRHHQDNYVNKAYVSQDPNHAQGPADLALHRSPSDHLPIEENGSVLPPPVPPSPDHHFDDAPLQNAVAQQVHTHLPELSQPMSIAAQRPNSHDRADTHAGDMAVARDIQVNLERLTLAQMAHSMEQNGHKEEVENDLTNGLSDPASHPLGAHTDERFSNQRGELIEASFDSAGVPIPPAPLMRAAPVNQGQLIQPSSRQMPKHQAPSMRPPHAQHRQMLAQGAGQPELGSPAPYQEGHQMGPPLGRPPVPPPHMPLAGGPGRPLAPEKRQQNGVPPEHVYHHEQAQLQRPDQEAQTMGHPPSLPEQVRDAEHDIDDQDLHDQKKKPEVSAGFRLKARKFAQSLQRSFVNKED